jgi:hypothetical protein
VSSLEIVAVIGIVGLVIYQQFAGQLLRARRVVVLPVIVTVIGVLNLRGHQLGPADIAWLTAGAAGSLLIGLAFGVMMRLQARDGVLWGQVPLRGLWLWAALIGWRVLIMVLANRTGAHVAGSTTPLLFTLGLNRVGQAAVIMARAARSGIPFAPEQDGRTFGGGLLSGHNGGPGGGPGRGLGGEHDRGRDGRYDPGRDGGYDPGRDGGRDRVADRRHDRRAARRY